jgi:hypothetical protein
MQQKPATSLIVANLLVIVSFMYRYFRSSGADLDQPAAEFGAEFTTVIDLNQLTIASIQTHSRSLVKSGHTVDLIY